jgi:hypothetical protein
MSENKSPNLKDVFGKMEILCQDKDLPIIALIHGEIQKPEEFARIRIRSRDLSKVLDAIRSLLEVRDSLCGWSDRDIVLEFAIYKNAEFPLVIKAFIDEYGKLKPLMNKCTFLIAPHVTSDD